MKLDNITIASVDTAAMVAFYNAVFAADLIPIPDTPLYRGRLGDLELLLCPNDIVGIVAEKNRIQLRFTVDDLEQLVRRATAHGGGAYGERHEDAGQIVWAIHDPDGNSIELRQGT